MNMECCWRVTDLDKNRTLRLQKHDIVQVLYTHSRGVFVEFQYVSCGILVEPVELKSPDTNLCGVSSNAVAGSTHKVINWNRYNRMSQKLSQRTGMWNFSRTRGIKVTRRESVESGTSQKPWNVEFQWILSNLECGILVDPFEFRRRGMQQIFN